MSLKTYQRQLIDLAQRHQILSWGDFTLKSGRKSPYFFNLGQLSSAHALHQLGDFFCEVIRENQLEFDVMFGPAYKGIPLVVATALRWFERYQEDIPFAYSRKEVKDHGEGGQIVGVLNQKKVLILDDVLTAGTATRESYALIQAAGGLPTALVVALDRQEETDGTKISESLSQQLTLPIFSILTAEHLLTTR